jgi:diguanylate cyclase (GGDEF)-like protein
MPTSDTILLVILIAIIVNLGLATALLLALRFRGDGAREIATATAGRGATMQASGRPVRRIGSFGPTAHVPTPTDPETGFDLPATWARWLDEEDARVRRYRRSATLVLVEIENLERLVERLGSDTVGRLVPPVALNLRRHARETDRLARLAVGRFGVLLPETDEIQAINYVERIRGACDAWLEAGGVASRLLIGWAEANNSRSVQVAVQAAEDRLNADRRPGTASAAGATDGAEGDDDMLEGVRVSA